MYWTLKRKSIYIETYDRTYWYFGLFTFELLWLNITHKANDTANITVKFYNISIRPLHYIVTSSPARSLIFPQSSERLQTSENSSKRACFFGSLTPGLAHLWFKTQPDLGLLLLHFSLSVKVPTLGSCFVS